MRSLSIQVQPSRSPGIDMSMVIAEFEAIGRVSALVRHHTFDSGYDNGEYYNFTFGTSSARELWQLILSNLYGNRNLAKHMQKASMAMCSSEEGWDDYLLLYHFDPTVALDDAGAL